MTWIRPIRKVIKSKPTIAGAGVYLKRAFGYGDPSIFDPFLLLEDFRSVRMNWISICPVFHGIPIVESKPSAFNLPNPLKIMEQRYQEVKSTAIPEVTLDGGARVR